MYLQVQYIQEPLKCTVQERDGESRKYFDVLLILQMYLSWNSCEVREAKKVGEPNADEEANEVLANKVDTDQVDGEEQSKGGHESSEAKSVD